MKPMLLALPFIIITFSWFGMVLFSLWMLTGMICWKYEWARNVMIACYIVGGFWVIAAAAI